MTIILIIYLGLSLLYWLWMVYGAIRLRQAVPLLAQIESPEPEPWPRLSVVIPACNEQDKLESAVRTLLAEDYPQLEIILVDDRSSDVTGQIIDRLATEDKRLKAIHISELPPGWMGKVHALNRGLYESSGEFVLFTDADVHFQPGTLRKALAYCLQQRLDHLAGLPDLWPTSFLLDSVIMVFVRHFLVFISRPWAVANPQARAYMGVGAFNLLRRSALQTTEGFEWLRQEVTDDMGLGLMMKRSGAKCGVVAAFGNVGLHWYRSIAEAGVGAEKSFATLSRFSLWRTMTLGLIALLMELSPILLLLPLFWAELLPVGCGGLLVLGMFVFSAVSLTRWARARILPALAAPLTTSILVAMFIRAGLLGWWRGGVAWRDSLYPSQDLRQGSRVRWP